MSLIFGELPAESLKVKPAKEVLWAKEVAELMERPGSWAHFSDYDNRPAAERGQLGISIRKGRLKAFRAGVFETRAIRSQLWVRYVGPND